MRTTRRQFLIDLTTAGLVLSPLAAALSACARSDLPEGMAEIKWDRDTCTRCNMIISDRRFASQVRGEPKQQNLSFDDIGCLVAWLKDKPWADDAATRIWVADSGSKDQTGKDWLDARKARYVGGKTSPMGYNFAAVRDPLPGSLDFTDVRQHILAKGT